VKILFFVGRWLRRLAITAAIAVAPTIPIIWLRAGFRTSPPMYADAIV